MLLNFQLNERNLITMVLLGLPGLRDRIARHRSFKEQFAVRLSLDSLNEQETESYIDFRLKRAGATRPIFTPDAIKQIYSETGGTPRTVNTLADLCLFEGARHHAKEIDASMVKVALESM